MLKKTAVFLSITPNFGIIAPILTKNKNINFNN